MAVDMTVNGMHIQGVGNMSISLSDNNLDAYCNDCDSNDHIEFIAPKRHKLLVFCARCNPHYKG